MFQESGAAIRYPLVVSSERLQRNATQGSGHIPVGEFFAALWRRKLWVAAGTFAGLVSAVLFLSLVTPRYTAVAQLLIDPNDLRLFDNAVTSSSTLSDVNTAHVESQVRVLTSDNVLRKVIETLGLDNDPEFVSSTSVLSRAREFVSSTLGIAAPAQQQDPVVTALQTLAPLVIARRQERTYVVDLSVASREAEKSALIANAIVKAYLEDQGGARTTSARRATNALSERLQELRDRVRDAEDRSEKYKVEHNILSTGGQLVNEQQLTELSNQLMLAGARVDEAKARFDQIETRRQGKTDPGAIAEAMQSQTMAALRAQQAEVLRRKAEMNAQLGERHPAMADINAQARDLQQMIDREVTRLAEAARGDFDRALATRQALQRRLDSLKQQAVTTSQSLVKLRELERDVEANRAVYQAFLTRSRETREQEGVNTANVRVLSEATLPNKRTWPPRTILVLAAALAFGAAAGGGLGFIRDRTDDRIHSRRGLEAVSDLPILAELSSLPAGFEHKRWARLLAKARGHRHGTAVMETLLDAPESGFAAGIHRLRYVLRATEPNGTPQMVLFLAPGQPGARSEVALNFALGVASNQSRVLLVDADLRRRELSRRVAGDSRAGLFDVADGRAQFESTLVAEPITGMMVLQAGDQAPGSGDRPVNPENIVRIVEHARRSYTVVVNGPTDRGGSLGPALAASANRTVLVVTVGLTRARDVADFQRSTELSSAKLSGIVLVSKNGQIV